MEGGTLLTPMARPCPILLLMLTVSASVFTISAIAGNLDTLPTSDQANNLVVETTVATTELSANDTTSFDVAVFNICQAIEKNKERSVVDKLLRSGIKPEIHYFDIFCHQGGLLLSSSLSHHNLHSARDILRYLRWRERETENTQIRRIILNAVDEQGETIVDKTQKKLSGSKGIAQKLEFNSFLALFKRHGGKCHKYCN